MGFLRRVLRRVLLEAEQRYLSYRTMHVAPVSRHSFVFVFIGAWPRYCRKVYWTNIAQNCPNDHFGQSDLIPNRILAFARPKWTILVHFGPRRSILFHFSSIYRTLAIPDLWGIAQVSRDILQHGVSYRYVCANESS